MLMKTRMLKTLSVAFCLVTLLPLGARADLALASVFGDSMVLQRERSIPVWGSASANQPITIRLRGQTVQTRSDASGRWSVTLPPMKAGGPHTLTVEGDGKTLVLTNVLLGDVWICSGQSNMGMPMSGTGRGTLDGEKEIAAANYPQLRLFTVYPVIATAPKDELGNHSPWLPCTPQSVKDFSAAAYFFGRHVHQKEKVAVGLILTAWGGTYAEAWTSRPGLAALPEFAGRLQEADANLPRLEQIEAEFRPRAAAWEDQMDALDAGMENGAPAWSKPECSTTDWIPIELPLPISKLAGAKPTKLGGRVWFRRDIEVPAELQGRDLRLNLGLVRDAGRVWFNGTEVSRSDLTHHFWDGHRPRIAASLVHPGKNTIVVRSTDPGGFGGVIADPAGFELAPATPAPGIKPLNLAGEWRMKLGAPAEKLTARPAPPSYWPKNPNMPTVLFNAMIHPLLRTPIKGAIWYQGEGNAGRAYEYRRLLPALIQDWRRAWGQGDFPFLFVQLAGFGAWQPIAAEPRECDWAELREAQLLTLATPKTGMAVAIDIGEAEDIHPINKRDVGVRLGLAAQSVAYSRHLEFSGPLYQSMKVKDGKAWLTFTHARGLTSKGGELKGFAIAGSDHKFHFAKAEIHGGKVVVWSDAVPVPVAVRYAWDFLPECTLYNSAGLPASPFRTDDWPGVTQPRPTAASSADTSWAREFFQNCAFVCIDIQPGQRSHVEESAVPKLWRQMGFTAADVNAASDFAFDVAYPNARKVVDACRSLHLPMIFVHWGCLFRDGMDLDPDVRKELLGQHGTNFLAWGHCVQDASARPAEILGVRPGDYVLPKSAQDAFRSSNISFLLTNLHVQNIVFIGGHTEACLGRTAQSAKQRGFKMLCVEDATFNARESTRRKGIEASKYDHVLTTKQFVELAKTLASAASGGSPRSSR